MLARLAAEAAAAAAADTPAASSWTPAPKASSEAGAASSSSSEDVSKGDQATAEEQGTFEATSEDRGDRETQAKANAMIRSRREAQETELAAEAIQNVAASAKANFLCSWYPTAGSWHAFRTGATAAAVSTWRPVGGTTT